MYRKRSRTHEVHLRIDDKEYATLERKNGVTDMATPHSKKSF